MKEKTLGDMIFSPIKPENPIDKGNEILFGKDGKPLSHHRCNICGILYEEHELELNDDMGWLCENCKDAMEELDEEQKSIETVFRSERNSKAGI